MNRSLKKRDDSLAGREPRFDGDGLTIASLVNQFLTAMQQLVETGELKQRTWQDYYTVCDRIVKVFGRNRLVSDLRPVDFGELRADFAKTRGAVALTNDITRCRIPFKWGYDSGLFDSPMRYGQSFNRPSQKTIRLAKAANGPRMFDRDELHAMLAAASQPLRSMMLLAINGGFGNSDVAQLPLAAVDLDKGWMDFPRPKTGIPRRIPLWNETKQSLRDWLKKRPSAKSSEHNGLLFVTRAGNSWSKTKDDNPVAKETRKLLKEVGLYRSGRGFYSIRRTFRTIASDSQDEAAADALMGHAPRNYDMAAVYGQQISDDRLRRVVEVVHDWLFRTHMG